MHRMRLIVTLVLVGGLSATAAEWRPSVRWRGFNLLNMFIKGDRPDPKSQAEADGVFCFRNPQEFPERDFAVMEELGFNFARLPLDYRYWLKDNDWWQIDETVVGFLDRAIERGRKHGVHVQLCFHHAPGYACYGTPRGDLFREGDAALAVCCRHWAYFAKRYRGIPNEALSFNLFNEPPKRASDAAYARVAKALVEAIRSEDPERFIMADGTVWGRWPVKELEGIHNLGQAVHFYYPDCRLEADSWPLTVDSPQGVICQPSKTNWYAPFELQDPPAGRCTVSFGRVSQTCTLTFAADGKPVGEVRLEPKKGAPGWTDVQFMDEWKIWQGTYTNTFAFAVPERTKVLTVAMVSGDWTVIGRMVFESQGRRAVLAFDRGHYENPSNFRQRFDGWEKGTFSSLDPQPRTGPFGDDPRLALLWRERVAPWLEKYGTNEFVMVGEFGWHGDEKSTLELSADYMKIFDRFGWGWAVWGLHGECGIFNAHRTGIEPVDFHGLKMDEKLLKILRGQNMIQYSEQAKGKAQ